MRGHGLNNLKSTLYDDTCRVVHALQIVHCSSKEEFFLNIFPNIYLFWTLNPSWGSIIGQVVTDLTILKQFRIILQMHWDNPFLKRDGPRGRHTM